MTIYSYFFYGIRNVCSYDAAIARLIGCSPVFSHQCDATTMCAQNARWYKHPKLFQQTDGS